MSVKILVADDEPDIRSLTQKGLEKEGFEVVLASDGEEALEKIQGENPDIIVLDIIMPKLNGFEVLTRLRSNPGPKWQPVIIISVKKEFDNIKKGYELEADYYITKPFSMNKLIEAVRLMLSLIPLRKEEEGKDK